MVNNYENKLIGQRIKTIRQALHLSQDKFARQIGVSTALICKLETGERALTDRIESAICTVFGVSNAYLRTGDGDMFVSYSLRDGVNELAVRCNLSPNDSISILEFLSLRPEVRNTIYCAIQAIIQHHITCS